MTGQATLSRAARRRREIGVVVVLVVVFAVLYAGVLALYAASERNISLNSCPADPPSDAILMSISPQAVDAAGNRIVATLTVLSFGPVESEETGLAETPLTVLVTGTDGPRTFDIGEDEIPSPESLRFITDGDIERWPFDRHAAQFAMVTIQGVGDQARAVPTELCGSVHVPGWSFASEEVAGTDDVVVNGEPVTQLRVVATRSAATVAFGIVILVLMIVLPVLALTVAVLAFRGIRKVEATLTSWMAAMLFATIPLRTFLPGSPPIGSWVDYLVVLWVVVGLVAGLAVYVAAWIRWASPGGRPVGPATTVPVAVPVRDADAANSGGDASA